MIYNETSMDNIVLIGMPSAGKSTAGVLLAKRIGYGFIDCDLIIQGEQGMRLSEIIDKEGAEGFIRIEERVNAGLFARRCVIATGGSVIYGARAMEHLKTLGKVVYLKLSVEEVAKRIPSFAKRGVVMRENVSTLEELYKERIPLYEQYADVTVECDGKTIDETVVDVATALGCEL
ncbi:MAG: shikimate kinase [Clostridiales bacterium]|nr:shikimate kinase [Clostridiales bacterium]